MSLRDDALFFSTITPHEDQRWSTWPTIIPSLRGPRPWPSSLVTSAGAIDTELGVFKSGKEADVFLIERSVPPAADSTLSPPSVLLAAKRHRSAGTSDLHRSSQYTEGRRTRRSRDSRALQKKSTYGRALSSGLWASAEFTGDGRVVAPRLAAVRVGPAELRDVWNQVVERDCRSVRKLTIFLGVLCARSLRG